MTFSSSSTSSTFKHNICQPNFFFLKKWTFVHFHFFVGHMSYLWPLVPLFLNFWWHLLWVSRQEWVLPYMWHCRGKCNRHSRRSTTGATRCRPLGGKHCGAPTRLISCPRILSTVSTKLTITIACSSSYIHFTQLFSL